MATTNAANSNVHGGGTLRESRDYTRQKWFRRLQVLLFALTMFLLWWLFSTLTEAVLTCVPGGDGCRWPWLAQKLGDEGSAPTTSMVREWTVVLFGLAMALWASTRLWFPPEDFDVDTETRRAAASATTVDRT